MRVLSAECSATLPVHFPFSFILSSNLLAPMKPSLRPSWLPTPKVALDASAAWPGPLYPKPHLSPCGQGCVLSRDTPCISCCGHGQKSWKATDVMYVTSRFRIVPGLCEVPMERFKIHTTVSSTVKLCLAGTGLHPACLVPSEAGCLLAPTGEVCCMESQFCD